MSAPEQPPPTRARLSAARIVEEALELARQEGVRGISMRPLAARFGVSATALYGHVASRDALLALMLESILADVPPLPEELSWDEALRLGAMRMRDAFGPYPQLALEALGGHAATEGTRASGGLLVQRLVDAGFSQEDAVLGIAVWGRWTLSYLAAAEHTAEGEEVRTDAAFEAGVDMLLDGLRKRLG
ncbi:MAG: Transcriptional regulator, TetR family [Solirubrobacterales bacterium]|jgi:AcrR family transcriptional regulator|nr:Transcriptional regulator, TetR family [Solirubrobacterales bacterium]